MCSGEQLLMTERNMIEITQATDLEVVFYLLQSLMSFARKIDISLTRT